MITDNRIKMNSVAFSLARAQLEVVLFLVFLFFCFVLFCIVFVKWKLIFFFIIMTPKFQFQIHNTLNDVPIFGI